MNNNVRKAVEAVSTANQLASRLAAVAVSADTTNCAVPGDNSEFTSAINAAQLAIEAALDEVDGPAHSEFDHALAAVQRARAAFFGNVPTNRKDAAAETATANQHAVSASRKV
jgi:hypothetical protein